MLNDNIDLIEQAKREARIDRIKGFAKKNIKKIKLFLIFFIITRLFKFDI